MAQFWWLIFPYLTLVVMVTGTLYRFVYAQRGWTSKSSEIFEKKALRWGSMLFHWGILCVIAGHIGGLLVPLSAYHAMGVSDELYHKVADIAGGIAGFATWLGLLILLIRRVVNKRVRKHSSVSDFVALILLFVVITLGDIQTIGYNNFVGSYEYRETVSPWIRGILLLHPDASLMAAVPMMLKIHIVLSLALFGISPFTRLVHVWSAPVRYPFRAPIQYRSRNEYTADAAAINRAGDWPSKRKL